MRRLLLVALALTAVAVAAAPDQATAAPYTVTACTEANPGNRLFAAFGTTGTCAPHIAADVNAPAARLGGAAWWLIAPTGTRITSFAISHAAQWSGGLWGSQIDVVGVGWLAGPCVAGFSCGWLPGPGGTAPWARSSRSGLAVDNLRLISWCVATPSCTSGWVRSQWKDIVVTLDDAQLPAIANGTGLWGAGDRWVRGAQPLAFDATDNTGVKHVRVEVDGRAEADQSYACDYGKAAPCENRRWSGTIDTTDLADGEHRLHLAAQDAADSWASPADRTFKVDNHAPDAPAIAVDGGEAPRLNGDWTIRWANPPLEHAPIVAAHYRVCRAEGGDCRTGRAAPADGVLSGAFGITEPGDYTLRLWLEDAAGNADPAQPSNAVALRWDNAPPGAASLEPPPERWLGGADALSYRQPIGMAPGADVPLSGIAGYAVTTDGSTPGTTVNVPAGADGTAGYGPPPGGWPEGVVRVKARAVSGTGRPADDIGELTLRFDRTAPTPRAYGQGGASHWQPGPVTVALTASDALSGMGAADGDRPVEEGGHIAWSLDGGATRRARGDEAEVSVAGNGRHLLTFRAYDAAGNVSADRTEVVNVGEPADGAFYPAQGFTARSTAGLTTFTAARTFAANCPERATLTASRDARVDQSRQHDPTGAGTTLSVRSAPGANARTLVAFDLPPARGCHLTSAQLRLHASDSTPARTLQAYRLGSSWDEDVTWATRPGATGTPAEVASGAGGWTAIDVTRQVGELYRSGDNGLLIRDRDESASPPATQTWSSREGSHPPVLVVTFG